MSSHNSFWADRVYFNTTKNNQPFRQNGRFTLKSSMRSSNACRSTRSMLVVTRESSREFHAFYQLSRARGGKKLTRKHYNAHVKQK